MLKFDFELELENRLGADNNVSHNSNELNDGKSLRQFGNLHKFDDLGDSGNFGDFGDFYDFYDSSNYIIDSR